MAIYVLSNTAIPTTLDEDLTDSELDITVVDGSTYPAADFITRVNLELIDVQSRSGNVLTVRSGGRGYNGTTAVAHSTSDIIEHVLDTADLPFRRTVGSVNWEAQGAIDLSNQRLYAPLDPTTGLDVGDRAYNDLRYAGIATIITDHDELAGLGDDDHSIYWNDTRGDAKILTHKNLVSAHHVKYTDAEAAAKIAADDLYVKIAGDTMGGALAMGNQILSGPLDPAAGTHVGDRDYNDARYIEVGDPPSAHTHTHASTTGRTSSDHHVRYADSEADARIALADLTDLADVVISGTPADNEIVAWNTGTSRFINQTAAEAGLATSGHAHSAIAHSATTGKTSSDHHVKYTDGEAVSAVGTPWVALIAAEDHDHATPIASHAALVSAHHVKYTDAEAAAKIAADDLYVKVDGDVMEGHLNIDDNELRFGNHPIGSADAWWFVENAGDLEFWARVNIEGWSSSLIWHVDNGQQTMDSALDMNGQTIWMNGGRIADPLDPTNGTHVGDRDYNDARYLEILGSTATGVIDRSGVAALTTKQFRNIYISDSAPGSPTEGDVWLDTTAAAGGGGDLADLDDVTITSIASGEMLQWNGSAWINQTFAELDIATLTYVNGLDHHTKYTDGEADARIALADLTDLNNVNITSVAGGEILKWGGSNWINNTLEEADIAALSGAVFTGNVELDGSNLNMIFPDTTKYVAGSGFFLDTTTSENLGLFISTDGGSTFDIRTRWDDEGLISFFDSAENEIITFNDDNSTTFYGNVVGEGFDTGFQFNNQGVSLRLGSQDVADNGVIPFIDFYSGSTVIAARIISSTDTGSSYTGGIQIRANHLLVDGDIRGKGDQLFFNYGTETTSYLQHSTGSNYFRFVQAGSEGHRFAHNGTTSHIDIYGTAQSYIRKVEGTHLYIDNEVANQDIFLRTDNGAGIKTRILIDGSANVIRFDNHDGTEVFRMDGPNFRPPADNQGYVGESAVAFARMYADWFYPNNELYTLNLTTTASTSYNETVWHTSDYRLMRFTSTRAVKENIRPLERWYTERLYDLTPRWFDVKPTHRTGDVYADFDQVGMIADEVWDVFGDHGSSPDEHGNPSGWTPRFMVPIIVAEMQYTREDMNALEARIAALEAA